MKKLLLIPVAVFAAILIAYGAGTTVNGTRIINGDLTVKGTCTGCGGGGLVLLEQHTASSSASLNFTSCISSTYDEYLIELVSTVPATNDTKIGFRMSTDGGASYDNTSGHYSWQALAIGLGGSGGNGSSSDSAIYITNDITNSQAYQSLNGSYRLFNPASTVLDQVIMGQTAGPYNGQNHSAVAWIASGNYLQLGASVGVNAFQVVAQTGNIASGTVRCYGIAKS